MPTCTVCGALYAPGTYFRTHQQTPGHRARQAAKAQPRTCARCPYSYAAGTYRDHMRMHTTPLRTAEIIVLRSQGKTYRAIGTLLGVSAARVHQIERTAIARAVR